MESWLPWLTAEEHLLPDLLPAGARVLLVEPRRMRDRAQDLLDEEAALGDTLAGTWGAEGHEFPRLSLPFDRLLARTHTATTSVLASPDHPDTPQLGASAFDPVVGDVEALADRIRALVRAEHRVVLAAEGEGSARRLADVLSGEGIDALVGAPVAPGAVTVVVAPLERGVIVAGAHLALVAEADLTGRRRVHRTARGARKAVDYYDDLKAGDFVVHQVHGVGRYEGMVARAIGGVERDYLLIAYRGGDKLYVPTDQVGTVRRYTGGDSPSLSRDGRRGVAEDPQQGARRGRGDRGRAGDPVPQAPRDARSRLRVRHAVAARARGRVPVRGDPRSAARDRGGQGGHAVDRPDGPPHLR